MTRFLVFAGLLFLAPGLPLFVAMIGGSEVVWFALLRLVAIFPALTKLPSAVYEWGVRVGRPYMRDERDAPYFLPTVFLTLWVPTLFTYCLWRYKHYGFEISTGKRVLFYVTNLCDLCFDQLFDLHFFFFFLSLQFSCIMRFV